MPSYQRQLQARLRFVMLILYCIVALLAGLVVNRLVLSDIHSPADVVDLVVRGVSRPTTIVGDVACDSHSTTRPTSLRATEEFVAAVLRSQVKESEVAVTKTLVVSVKARQAGWEIQEFFSEILGAAYNFNATVLAHFPTPDDMSSSNFSNDAFTSSVVSFLDIMVGLMRRNLAVGHSLHRLEEAAQSAGRSISFKIRTGAISKPPSAVAVHDLACFYAEMKQCLAVVDHLLHDVELTLDEERSRLFEGFIMESPYLPRMSLRAAAALRELVDRTQGKLDSLACVELLMPF